MDFKINEKLIFPSGHRTQNRFMLAPMTNTQSLENGQLSDDEYKWLIRRAEGGFGLVMTCASHVLFEGKGFPGQLGIYSDDQIPGHQRLTQALKNKGCISIIQLHHAGMRAPSELIKTQPVCPSNIKKYNARALTLQEIDKLKDAFIAAARRAQKSGYDGVEIHGAHGYILTQFLSTEINKRTDNYGGSFENRSRLIFEIIKGIRSACGGKFILGIRLSPERFGMKLMEIKNLCQLLIDDGLLDFIDISLWDYTKYPEESKYQDKTLLAHFTEMDYHKICLTVSGNIRNGEDVTKVMCSGVDFVTIGRAGILHHDFPLQVLKDPNFRSKTNPVTEDYLRDQGLGEKFITYLKRWPDFVK